MLYVRGTKRRRSARLTPGVVKPGCVRIFGRQSEVHVAADFLLAVVGVDCVGNMASSDVHVRICEQEILKYDLEIKALIQVRATR